MPPEEIRATATVKLVNMYQQFLVEFGRVVSEMCEGTDRQTDIIIITIL